jgi:PleD family two-component response regulator
VESLIFEYDAEKFSITISAGLATLAEGNYKNHETFFRAADGQLLRAKKSGRNRVHFALEGVSDTMKAKLG